MEFLKLMIYFAVFSFCGWVSETIICSFEVGKFVKRGFLAGPFIPLYGFGGLVVVYLLAPFANNTLLLYFVGMISVTVLEYATGTIMENIFGLKLWDYSRHKLQVKGRIWLGSSVFFGFLGLLCVYIIYPPVFSFVNGLTDQTVLISGISLIVYFLTDMINSIFVVAKIKVRIRNIEEYIRNAVEELEIHVDEFEINHKAQVDLRKQIRITRLEKRLMNAYPNMSPRKYKSSFDVFKHLIDIVKRDNEKTNTSGTAK